MGGDPTGLRGVLRTGRRRCLTGCLIRCLIRCLIGCLIKCLIDASGFDLLLELQEERGLSADRILELQDELDL